MSLSTAGAAMTATRSRRRLAGRFVPLLAMLAAALSFVLPLALTPTGAALRWTTFATPFVGATCGLFAASLALLRAPRSPLAVLLFCALSGLAAVAPLLLLSFELGDTLDASSWRSGFWCFVVALLLLAILGVQRVAALDAPGTFGAPDEPHAVDARRDAASRSTAQIVWRTRLARFGTPAVFGAWVLVFWQLLTQALEVPRVLLPAPSVVWHSLSGGYGVLVSDFAQTVLHSVVIGLVAGSALGFVTGVLIDRSPFLRRGLLPLAALASAVPLIGIAPIMVMWFGFDWHSKAAVVVVMTFFPMLVNTLAGLAESGHMERDLMRSYGAGYWRTLASLRIPVALPFVFNALKIDSTLAMIGAIVAEFFGSPTSGLGFRISTEAARLNMGLVWAAILVAAVTGSVLYGTLAWVERRATFWHPSIRSGA